MNLRSLRYYEERKLLKFIKACLVKGKLNRLSNLKNDDQCLNLFSRTRDRIKAEVVTSLC
ncbi:hypothetical protein [Paenibacillus catalpae]|uniref:hypothetical protein n=1 Tax=Paenibacillus catalpae TaxID=1045775 RepID=UPI001FE91884|nr:hypothetical protein [Paenibacillus catalpae]